MDVVEREDKREMTVLFTCTMSGSLLPPHLIYTGKTNKCHPSLSSQTLSPVRVIRACVNCVGEGKAGERVYQMSLVFMSC